MLFVSNNDGRIDGYGYMKQGYQGRKLDGVKLLDGNVKAARVENGGRVLSQAIQTDSTSDLCDLNWLSQNEEGIFPSITCDIIYAN